MKKPGRFTLKCLAAVLSGAIGCLANAQQELAIDEIVVTAQKREQSIVDVPISLTAIGQGAIETRSMRGMADYIPSVPSMGLESEGPTGGQSGDRMLSIRGLNSVGLYINETNVRFVDPHLFDVNRIEVLRGPQGTLYGAGSMGGTLKIVTNEPDSTAFSSRVRASASSVSHGDIGTALDALLNVPLSESVAFRLSAFNHDDAGYIDNVLDASTVVKDFNQTQTYGGRAVIRLNLSDRASLTASAFSQRREQDGDNRYITIRDAAALFPGQSLAPIAENFLGNELVTHKPIDVGPREDFDLFDFTFVYDFEFGTLTGVVTYFDYTTKDYIDHSQFLGPVNLFTHSQEESFNTEIRLAANDGDTFDWLVGFFYQDNDVRLINDLELGGTVFFGQDSPFNTSQTAVFGEVIYRPDDNWTLTGGLRLVRFEQEQDINSFGLFAGPPLQDLAYDENGTAPRFTVAYAIDDTQNVYASVSQGFRGGRPGFPIPESCGVQSQHVEVDSLWNYEIGYKASQLANGRLSLSSAVYFIDWTDIPQSVLLQPCGFEITDNVGKASSRGGELELAFAATDALSLTLGFGYVDAKLDADSPLIGASKGDRLLNTPEWNVAASATYNWSPFPAVDAFFSVNYSSTGDAVRGYDFSTPNAAFLNSVEAWDNLGFRAGATIGRWDVALFGTNMLNERPNIGSFQFVSPELYVGTLRPRTIGVEVNLYFD